MERLCSALSFRAMPSFFRLLMFFLLTTSSVLQAENLQEAADRSGSFRNFLSAAKAAGILKEFTSPRKITLFLPTDTALAQLPDGEWETLLRDKKQLSRVLRYHMMPGKVKVTEVKPGPVKSLEGSVLTLKSDNGMVTVNGARVTESDLVADNGIIHGIDQLLIPPD